MSIFLPFSLPALVPDQPRPNSAGREAGTGWSQALAGFPAPSPHRDPHRTQGAARPIPISAMAVGEDEEGPAFFQASVQPAVGDV